MIRPYLSNIIDDHKDEWKVQLTMEINFISITDSSDTSTVHIENQNIITLTGYEADDIIEKLFESLLEKYQQGLEEKLKKVTMLLIVLMHCIINFIKQRSYIDSPEWINDKCSQYAITVALNHQNILKNPHRITKSKPFIDQYDWNKIEFPSHQKDWKIFELNNKIFALNVLFIPVNTKKIRPACLPIYSSSREKQVFLLMITAGKKMALSFCEKDFLHCLME